MSTAGMCGSMDSVEGFGDDASLGGDGDGDSGTMACDDSAFFDEGASPFEGGESPVDGGAPLPGGGQILSAKDGQTQTGGLEFVHILKTGVPGRISPLDPFGLDKPFKSSVSLAFMTRKSGSCVKLSSNFFLLPSILTFASW
jgi:hypothetical protein